MLDIDYAAAYAQDPATPELHNLNHQIIDLCEDISAYGDTHAGDRHADDPNQPIAFEHALSVDLLERITQALADVDTAGTLNLTASPFVAQSILTRTAALHAALALHAAATANAQPAA